ncbi:MAG: hypothetical protein CMJ68_24005 [Planctomycetaceae bacterium]|nr:hypothetical protein [Planctomycetaceae bacterium]
MVEGEVVVGRSGRCLATSRLELTAGAFVRRSVETEGVRMSRFEEDDGFLMSRLEGDDGFLMSRFEEDDGFLMSRFEEDDGVLMSRLEEDDGFLMSRFELVDGRRSREEVRDRGAADFEDLWVVTVLGKRGICRGDEDRVVFEDGVRRVDDLVVGVLRLEGALERDGCAEVRLDPREGNLTVLRDDALREEEPRELGLRDDEERDEEERAEEGRDEEERDEEERDEEERDEEERDEEERAEGGAERRDEPDREDERLTVRVETEGRFEDRGEREVLLEERPELRDDDRPEDFWASAMDGVSSSARTVAKLTMLVAEAPRLVWLLNVGFGWCRMSTPFHKLIALLSGCPSGLIADTVPISAPL